MYKYDYEDMRKVVRYVITVCVRSLFILLKFGLDGRMRDDMTSLARSEFLACETLIVWRQEAGGKKGGFVYSAGQLTPCSWKTSERTSTCGSMSRSQC